MAEELDLGNMIRTEWSGVAEKRLRDIRCLSAVFEKDSVVLRFGFSRGELPVMVASLRNELVMAMAVVQTDPRPTTPVPAEIELMRQRMVAAIAQWNGRNVLVLCDKLQKLAPVYGRE